MSDICANLACLREVAEEDYYTWLVPPVNGGGVWSPCCSWACGRKAYYDRSVAAIRSDQ